MKRPWMPLYVGDYLGDTGHLTTTQHGAYLLLMMHYWRKGEIPDDDIQLAKITRLPLKAWELHRPVLQEFFHDGWHHKRIDAELAKMLKVSSARAVAGQKGGIGSALSRMKLENASLSKHIPRQAIAEQMPSKAAAIVDHSHSHIDSTSSTVSVERGKGLAEVEGVKPPHQVSRTELDAAIAKRRGLLS